MRRSKPPVWVSRSSEFDIATVSDLICQLRAEEEDYPVNSLEYQRLKASITAARNYIEAATGRVFVDSTVDVYFDSFESKCIDLNIYPVRELVSIDYIGVDSDWHQLDLSVVDADFVALRPYISADWPSTAKALNAVKVRLNVGCQSREEIPGEANVAALMLAAHLYQNASASAAIKLEEVPLGVKSMIDILRVTLL